MAGAVAAGSLLASGGGAIAGLSSTGTFLGLSTGAFSAIGAGLGIAGQFLAYDSGQDLANANYEATLAASRAELEATRTRVAENNLGAQRERTQAAIDEAERQRRLRRALAAQRASFAGGSVDINSGSFQAIQDDTIGEINRESRLAELATQDTVNAINTQGLGIQAAGNAKASSLIGQANTNLAASRQRGNEQLVGIGQSVSRFSQTLKGLND